jgi:hypothetical protein
MSSAEHDPGGLLRRAHKDAGPAPVVMKRVKGVGRHARRYYCQACGQRLHVCRCDPAPDPPAEVTGA